MPKVVDSEAKTIRLIYTLFLQGRTHNAIARYLTANGIPTPGDKTKWCVSTVMSILQTEKCKGDAVLQKHFTVDFLTKKVKYNEGEVPQFYVENSHPAIIEPERFELVQSEIKRRRASGQQQSGLHIYSSWIIWGECGGYYGSKVWHSTSKYRRTIWQCNNKYKNGGNCQTPHLYEAAIQRVFIEAFNCVFTNRDRLIEDYTEIIQVLTDMASLDKECADVMQLIQKIVDDNARIVQD